MKKGFTIVELLAVLAIMTIILLMAVPAYTGVVSIIHQRVYDSKITEVLAKSEIYSEETGKTVFNINALIEAGKIEADNESGVFEDPRDGRDMSCDMINVLLKDGGYDVTITEDYEKNCYDSETLENLHGITSLKVVKSPTESEEVTGITGTNWLRNNEVYVTYELKEDYKEYEGNIESILWYGEEEKVCSLELGNLSDCKYYPVKTTGVLNTEVHFQITIRIQGVQIQNENSKSILLDTEYPIILDGSITKDDEYNSNSERRIQFELSDRNGSGVKEYTVVKYDGGNLSCNVSGYKETSEGVQTEFLESGSFYICVKDKVGNVIDDETLNQKKDDYLFEVDNTSNEKPKWIDDGSGESIKVVRSQANYNDLNPYVSVNVVNADGGIDGLKLCISASGYLDKCSWVNYEGYSQKIQVSLPKRGPEDKLGYDGGTRVVYVSVQDKYGNVIERSKEYTVYKACTVKTGFEEVSNTSSSCPKCGIANYNSNKKNKDQYLGVYCDSKTDPVQCNIPTDCCSSTVISGYGPWKACSASCGGGIQRRDVYYVSAYDSSKSCPTKTDGSSKSCNTQVCRQYLFLNGTHYLTGGYMRGNYTRGMPPLYSIGTTITIKINASGNQTTSLLSKNKIDLTNYNKIVYNVQYATTQPTQTLIFFFATDRIAQGSEYTIHSPLVSHGDLAVTSLGESKDLKSFDGTVSVDISKITGAHNIAFTLDGYTDYKTASLVVSEIYLE